MQACCCGFLYFNRHLLEAGLADVVAHPHEARKVPYLMAAFSDAHRLLHHTILDPKSTHQVGLFSTPFFIVWQHGVWGCIFRRGKVCNHNRRVMF